MNTQTYLFIKRTLKSLNEFEQDIKNISPSIQVFTELDKDGVFIKINMQVSEKLTYGSTNHLSRREITSQLKGYLEYVLEDTKEHWEKLLSKSL